MVSAIGSGKPNWTRGAFERVGHQNQVIGDCTVGFVCF
jgi:hypothetical protein